MYYGTFEIICLFIFILGGIFIRYCIKIAIEQKKEFSDNDKLGYVVFAWSYEEGIGLKGSYHIKPATSIVQEMKNIWFLPFQIKRFDYTQGAKYIEFESTEGEKFRLPNKYEEYSKSVVSKIAKDKEAWEKRSKKEASPEELHKLVDGYTDSMKIQPKPKKDASVVGRAVAGGIIAGPAGAVVGALSAVDKNNKNKQKGE